MSKSRRDLKMHEEDECHAEYYIVYSIYICRKREGSATHIETIVAFVTLDLQTYITVSGNSEAKRNKFTGLYRSYSYRPYSAYTSFCPH